MKWNGFRPLLLMKRSTWWRRSQGYLQNRMLERKIWYISFTWISGGCLIMYRSLLCGPCCHKPMHMCILLFGHPSQISSEKHLLVQQLKTNYWADWVTYVCHFTRFKMIYAASIGLLLSVQTIYKLKLPSFMILHLLWKSNGKPTWRELKRHSNKMYHLLNRNDASWQGICSSGKLSISTVKLLISWES